MNPDNSCGTEPMDYPKKWWWLVLIVVPIVAALIGLLKNGSAGGNVYVAGPQFTGPIAFNDVTVIVEQARRIHGKELATEVVEKLQKVSDSVETGNFREAISLLESVATSAPVPALFNNLGAAHLATGDFDKAKSYLEKATAAGPDEKSQFNLGQIPECGPLVGEKDSMPGGGDTFESAAAIPPGLYILEEAIPTGVHRYFKAPLKAGQTLVIAFRTPNRFSHAGARIYDRNGGSLTQGALAGGGAQITTTKWRAKESGGHFFSIGNSAMGYPNDAGTVYRICVW